MGGKALSTKERALARALYRQGKSRGQIAKELGRHRNSVAKVLDRDRGSGVVYADWDPGPHRLSLEQREEIALGISRGEAQQAIAASIGVSASTVCREVQRNGGRRAYRATTAHRAAFGRARRPKPTKLASCPELKTFVVTSLEELWSPQEIAHRLRRDHKDDPMMWVSHETIYQSLYVQGRGELRRELARCLRSGRATRKPRGTQDHPLRHPSAPAQRPHRRGCPSGHGRDDPDAARGPSAHDDLGPGPGDVRACPFHPRHWHPGLLL